jgi:cytochrome P450
MILSNNDVGAILSVFSDLSQSTVILRIVFTIFVVYYVSFGYCFVRNLYLSRKTGLSLPTCKYVYGLCLPLAGLPSIIIPWDQNSFFWMISSVPLRPWLKKYAPNWIYNRLSLTIYCWEYLERLRPMGELSKDREVVDSFQYVTCGRFEVWTRDREVAIEILRRPDDFRVFELVPLFMDKFGQNVISVDNPKWARHRKIVASVINERISKSVFNESLKQTDGMLEELLGGKENRAESTTTARTFDMMKKITIHVLSGAGMGVSPPWHNEAAEKPKAGFKMTYIEAVKVIIDAMAGPIILPAWLLLNWPKAFPGAQFLRSLGVGMQEFPVHLKEMLGAERVRAMENPGQRANIMSQLIAASEQPDPKEWSKNLKNRALSEEEMMGNLFVFTAAGFDTTANTLSYALALLARYPQWQEWLIEEIDSIVPTSTDLSDWDYAMIFPRVTRVMAFMLETLRLCPPLIHIVKTTRAPQTITVSHGTYWIPANTSIYINNVALHLKPDIWRDLNQPPEGENAPHAGPSPFEAEDGDGDEARFRPTRWINQKDRTLYQPPRGAFLPWSTGPRVCPGQKMAQVEFTTIFLRMLSVCRIEAEPLEIKADGFMRKETRKETNLRLDSQIRNSISLLTLQMNGVYNVNEAKGEGFRLKLTRRSRAN